MRAYLRGSVLCVMVVLLSGVMVAGAQEPAQEPDARVQEMMAAWARIGTPGEEHALLAGREGEWQVTVTLWFGPGAPPQTSEATSVITPIFGNRYIVEKYTGSMPDGSPFHGMGIAGYDNFNEKFVAIWIDDMSTGIFPVTGTPDASGKVVTYLGEMPDPISGSLKPYRAVETFVDEDTRRFESFEKGPYGEEYRAMEMVYTRKK